MKWPWHHLLEATLWNTEKYKQLKAIERQKAEGQEFSHSGILLKTRLTDI